jgi:hypothetical protein
MQNPFGYNVPSSSLEGGSSSDVTNNQMNGNSMINSDENHYRLMNIDRQHHHSNPNHNYVSTVDERYSSSQPTPMAASASMSASTVSSIAGGMTRRMSAGMPTTITTSTNSNCPNMLSPPIGASIEQHFYPTHNNNNRNKNNNVDHNDSTSSPWGNHEIEPIPLSCPLSAPYAPFPTAINSTTTTITASNMKSEQQQQGMTDQYQQGKYETTREKNQLSQLPQTHQPHEQIIISQKEQRQKFLIFVYILFKYIDEAAKMQTCTKVDEHFSNKNKTLKLQARQVIKECNNGCRLGIKGYSPLVNVIQSKLRIVPNIDSHWDLASQHCHFFWVKRKRRDKYKGKSPMNKRSRNAGISTNTANITNDKEKDKHSKINWGDFVSYKKQENNEHETMDSTIGGERERSNNNVNVKVSRDDFVSYKKQENNEHGTMDSTIGGERESSNNNVNVKVGQPNTNDDGADYMEMASKIEFI